MAADWLGSTYDIIQGCQERYLNHALKWIFLSLDLNSLINADQVSKSWRAVVVHNEIWPIFLKKQLSTDRKFRSVYNFLGLWKTGPKHLNSHAHCKRVCLQVHSSIKKSDHNLRTGKYVKKHSTSSSTNENDVHMIRRVTMNERYIITVRDRIKLFVWDRSTSTNVKVLKYRMDVGYTHYALFVKIDDNDQVAYATCTFIYIWDIKSGTLIHDVRHTHDELNMFDFKFNMIFMASIIPPYTGSNGLMVYRIMDKSHLRSNLGSYLEPVFNLEFTSPNVLEQFVIDETHVVLLVGNMNRCWPIQFRIMVLCSETFQTLGSSDVIPRHLLRNTLAYANGCVVIGSHECNNIGGRFVNQNYQINVFDVETLTCRYTFNVSHEINQLRIGHNFLMTVNSIYEIEIWDFRAMCSGTRSSVNMNSVEKSGGNWPYLNQLLFDDLQMVFIYGNTYRTKLIVVDFVN